MTNQSRQPYTVLLARLLEFLVPLSGWVALSVLLSTATVASSIGLLGASAYIIAEAALHPSIAVIQVAIVGVRFFGITRGLFRYLERLVSHSTNFRLLAELRVWFYNKIEPLAPARLIDQRSGDLLGRAVADIDTLENFYVRVVAPPLSAALITMGMAVFIGRWDWGLAGILIGGLLLGGIAVPLLAYKLGRSPGQRLIAERAGLQTALIDGIQGMADLLAYGQADAQIERIRDYSLRVGQAQIRLAWAGGVSNALSLLITNLTLLLTMVTAIPMVSGGRLEGVLLAVLAMLVLSSFEAVSGLPQAGQQLGSSLAAARRLFAIADAQPAVEAPAQPSPAPCSPHLRICDLEFSYAAELPPVLKNINLELEPGKHIALVGTSGAGKTTLIYLLLRFWDCPPGSIWLGDQDIRSYQPEDVRRLTSVISQNTYLFAASVRQNLLLASPDASEDRLWEVLRQVELEKWVKTLPEGLDTFAGERGQSLSGGERQRVAIARALLQNTPLVLLDEPTAHLDAATERQLINMLNHVLNGKSVIWATHRLTGLDGMDEILVLRDGSIVERGSHTELMRCGGQYASLWSLQNRVVFDSRGTNSFEQAS